MTTSNGRVNAWNLGSVESVDALLSLTLDDGPEVDTMARLMGLTVSRFHRAITFRIDPSVLHDYDS